MQIKELGHVVLYVTNLEKLADFYKNTLGFNEIARSWPMAVFSSGRTHHELLLIEVGGEKKYNPRPLPGLYHIGFKIGDGKDAAKGVYKELKEKGIKMIGATDHGVTHSIYIADPDGNEIELYADVSDKWKIDPEIILTESKRLDLE